jgi:peptidoglycan-associated lipoprotein
VTSVSPSAIAPNAAAAAKVYGSSFQNGATVTFVGATKLQGQEVVVSDSNTLSLTIPALPLGVYDVLVANPDGDRSTLRSGLTVKVMEIPCRQATVNFGFDVHALSSSARSTLDGHMSCYQSLSGQVKIEGHADERGTVDYNLALGQRRADAVKRHLTGGGVSGSRISTVSYGEERPASSGHNESAWSKNRRAEISAAE